MTLPFALEGWVKVAPVDYNAGFRSAGFSFVSSVFLKICLY